MLPVRSALDVIIDNQQAILVALANLPSGTSSRAQECPCGVNIQPSTNPPIPLAPVTLPDLPQTAADNVLCRRLQKEIDNLLSTWEDAVQVVATTGAISTAVLAAMIGTALAVETGGMSFAAVSGAAAALSAGVSLFAQDLTTIPGNIRQQAAIVAYQARESGSRVANSAAREVIADAINPQFARGAFELFFDIWGGLNRAFSDSAIGDSSSYPLICAATYLTRPVAAGGVSNNFTYVVWSDAGISGTANGQYTYAEEVFGSGSQLAGRTLTVTGGTIVGYVNNPEAQPYTVLFNDVTTVSLTFPTGYNWFLLIRNGTTPTEWTLT